MHLLLMKSIFTQIQIHCHLIKEEKKVFSMVWYQIQEVPATSEVWYHENTAKSSFSSFPILIGRNLKIGISRCHDLRCEGNLRFDLTSLRVISLKNPHICICFRPRRSKGATRIYGSYGSNGRSRWPRSSWASRSSGSTWSPGNTGNETTTCGASSGQSR